MSVTTARVPLADRIAEAGRLAAERADVVARIGRSKRPDRIAALRREANHLDARIKELRSRQVGDDWEAAGFPPVVTMAEHQAMAEWVLAHSQALADDVAQGRWTLLMAVEFLREHRDCTFSCGHRPLTAEQIDHFMQLAEEGLL